jgi:hypothetical protein
VYAALPANAGIVLYRGLDRDRRLISDQVKSFPVHYSRILLLHDHYFRLEAALLNKPKISKINTQSAVKAV